MIVVILFGMGSFLLTAFSYLLGVLSIAMNWQEISTMIAGFVLRIFA